MAFSTAQQNWFNDVTENIDTLGDSMDTLFALRDMYTDRGYGSGGGNEIVAQDLTDAGEEMTVAQLTNAMTLIDQLKNFRDNAAVTTGDYGATISQVRKLA